MKRDLDSPFYIVCVTEFQVEDATYSRRISRRDLNALTNRSLGIKRFCILYPTSRMTDEICIDFNYFTIWTRKNVFTGWFLIPVSFLSEVYSNNITVDYAYNKPSRDREKGR